MASDSRRDFSTPSRTMHSTILGGPDGSFPPTQMTLLVSVRDGNPIALEEFCRIYRAPVYRYIRLRGNNHDDAEDLTQGFFYTLLKRKSLNGLDPSKGRLRTFLLTAVSRFMASEYQRRTAKKRGGGASVLPLDCGLAEEGLVPDPGHQVTADLEFERQWALELLKQALERTRTQEIGDGRGALFEELKGTISLDGGTDRLASIGQRLGMNEGAVKTASHRLRKRFRDNFRTLVAETVSAPSDVDEEIRHLMDCFNPSAQNA